MASGVVGIESEAHDTVVEVAVEGDTLTGGGVSVSDFGIDVLDLVSIVNVLSVVGLSVDVLSGLGDDFLGGTL